MLLQERSGSPSESCISDVSSVFNDETANDGDVETNQVCHDPSLYVCDIISGGERGTVSSVVASVVASV